SHSSPTRACPHVLIFRQNGEVSAPRRDVLPLPMTGFSADDLHQHADAMRRLARDLLPDRSLADDVVQQAYVTAIERPPPATFGLGGWLLSIVRSRAIDLQRSEVRRRQREGAVANTAHNASLTPSETAERFELQAAI